MRKLAYIFVRKVQHRCGENRESDPYKYNCSTIPTLVRYSLLDEVLVLQLTLSNSLSRPWLGWLCNSQQVAPWMLPGQNLLCTTPAGDSGVARHKLACARFLGYVLDRAELWTQCDSYTGRVRSGGTACRGLKALMTHRTRHMLVCLSRKG